MEHFKKLTPLEVLLLSFVKYGLSTSYDLMSEAGMSVGLSSQAFRRLKKSGLLTGIRGPRKSERFTLTAKGEKELQEALNPEREGRSEWLSRFGVFESVPKAMFLDWFSCDQESGATHLNWSMKELEHRISEKKEEVYRCLREIKRIRSAAPDDDSYDMGTLVAMIYRWMKAVSDAALLQGQIEALEKVAPLLSRMPSIDQPRDEFLKAIQILQDIQTLQAIRNQEPIQDQQPTVNEQAVRNLLAQIDLVNSPMKGDNPRPHFSKPMSDATLARLEDLELQGSGSPKPEPSPTPRNRKSLR